MPKAKPRSVDAVLGELDEETLLTTEEVAPVLGIASLTLRQWRVYKRGPDYIRLNPTAVRYRVKAVRAYLAGLTEVSAADPHTAVEKKTTMPKRPTRRDIEFQELFGVPSPLLRSGRLKPHPLPPE